MKRNMVVGIAMAVGILSFGALSASAADSCCKNADKQAVQKFTQETAGLTREFKAKDIELREQYGYDGINIHKVGELEAELKGLKGRINAAAQKHGISDCSCS